MSVVRTLADHIITDSTGHKLVRQLYTTRRGKERYRYVALISCSYCGTDFIPTRRGVHKYCSNSCRSRACKERNNYVYRQYLPTQPIAGINLVPAPNQEKWSWMRTGENAAASGAVVTVQYFALKEMISQQFNTLKSQISLSEQRTVQKVIKIIEAKEKGLLKAPRKKSIDAKAFEDIANKML